MAEGEAVVINDWAGCASRPKIPQVTELRLGLQEGSGRKLHLVECWPAWVTVACSLSVFVLGHYVMVAAISFAAIVDPGEEVVSVHEPTLYASYSLFIRPLDVFYALVSPLCSLHRSNCATISGVICLRTPRAACKNASRGTWNGT